MDFTGLEDSPGRKRILYAFIKAIISSCQGTSSRKWKTDLKGIELNSD
jgi:hypothetical protein